MTMAFTCETCLYWAVNDVSRSKGQCRRHAPPPNGTGFPETWHEVWCGEGTMDIEKAREKEKQLLSRHRAGRAGGGDERGRV